MTENQETTPNGKQSVVVKTTWAKATERISVKLIGTLGVVAVITISLVFIWKAMNLPGETLGGAAESTGRVVERAGRGVLEFARNVKNGTITTNIKSQFVDIEGVQKLQVAELSQVERFERQEDYSYFWNLLPTPTVIAEVEVPVTYVYYLDFNEEWQCEFDEIREKLTIVAPLIKWNQPSIDMSQLKTSVSGSIIRFDEAEVEENLKKGITAELNDVRAVENVKVVREVARNTVRDFWRNWLRDKASPDGYSPKSVEVFFADEESPIVAPEDSQIVDTELREDV